MDLLLHGADFPQEVVILRDGRPHLPGIIVIGKKEFQLPVEQPQGRVNAFPEKNPRLHSVGKQSKIPVNESLQGGADERHDGPV